MLKQPEIKQSNAIYCDHGPKNWQLSSQGNLVNLTLAVKDVFSIKGEKNSAGNPAWLAHAKQAKTTASALNTLMLQGCKFTSFTHTDELAYSLEGNNIHYGCAENPILAGHACGGSTMGSAAAVASKQADIGLGTDTGGSIRIPASYCGLYGIRPSHDVIKTDGLIPLAPPFDTIGWLTSSAEILERVGNVLLPNQHQHQIDTILIYEPLFDLIDKELQPLLINILEKIKPLFKHVDEFKLTEHNFLSELADSFRVLQGRAIARQHQAWINKIQPVFSDAITDRFNMAFALTAYEEAEALKVQSAWQEVINNNLKPNNTLFLPTTPTTAPKIGADTHHLRMKVLTLSAIAGLSRCPQIHLPLCPTSTNAPYGFSLLGQRNNDKSLLALSTTLTASLKGN
jgi:amidase/aspartyl-tRNA(Asn)/glutamyl-tRNA(Gln) amidotransferase subunit A